MDMNKKDGGPAYAIIQPYADVSGSICVLEERPGMTMRQAYKIAALTGMIQNSHEMDFSDAATATAIICGKLADAMIAEDEANG